MSIRKKFINRILAIVLVAMLAIPAFTIPASAVTLNKTDFTFYMVPNSHLDTSWQWPFQYTAETLLRTMYYNMTRSLAGNATYRYSTSASKHFEWIKEYYDDQSSETDSNYLQIWNRVKTLVANGQLDITGGQVVEPDLNVPNGESLVRQSLYAQHFFEREFGKDKIPVTGFVPDVFGFCGQFPQFLYKSEMKYFVTSKLNWNDTNSARDSDIFYWRALDGKSTVLSYVLAYDYPTTNWSASMVQNAFDRNWQSGNRSTNVKKAMGFFGGGDNGAGLPYSATPSGGNSYAAPTSLNSSAAATVRMATCTQYFNDVTADIATDPAINLRTVNGEMYFEYHRGTYTTWARMKGYNRTSEILAESAEKAATVAFYTGSIPHNSQDKLEIAWDKVLINQMHDVLPGSACPYTYYVAFNDHELAQNLFRGVRDNALLSLAYRANTDVSGKPVFVYNPLSWTRDGEVTVTLKYDELPVGINIFDGTTQLYPSKVVTDVEAKALTVSFVAKGVPAIGYKVFNIVENADALRTSDLSVNEDASFIVVENEFLKMTVNKETGYIKSLINKVNNVESFVQDTGTEGAELHVYFDTGGSSWPAWDLVSSQMNKEPDVIITGAPVTIEVVENSPEKVVVKSVKAWDASLITQYYILHAGSDKVDVRMVADWFQQNRLLKVSFPIAANNTVATYETSYGALQRPTTRDDSIGRARFEVPGHKFLDVTDSSGTFGVSILNDAKYGFDSLRRTVNGKTYVRSRITVVRTPNSGPLSVSSTTFGPAPNYTDSGTQDFMYSIYPHTGSWEDAGTVNKAYELNYPLTAFESAKSVGELGASKSFASSDKPNVPIVALKNQYDDPGDKDTLIVRVYESSGRDTNNVTLTLPGNIISAKEVNMLEHVYAGDKAMTWLGDKLSFDIGKYEILTIEVKLQRSPLVDTAPELRQEQVPLSYTVRGTTPNSNRRAALSFDGTGTTASPALTIPSDNWPSQIDYQGIKFDMGPVAGNNFVQAGGQNISLPTNKNYTKLLIVGAATGANPVTADFSVDMSSIKLLDGANAVTLNQARGRTVNLYAVTAVDISDPDDAVVLAATYSADGKMVGISTIEDVVITDGILKAEASIAIPASAGSIKVFVWDAQTYVPLTQALDTATVSATQAIRFDSWRTDLSGWDRTSWFDTKPYVYDTVAHYIRHYHSSTGTSNSTEAKAVDRYLFAYSIDLDPGMMITNFRLPNNANIKIAAVSLVYSSADDYGKCYDASTEPKLVQVSAPSGLRATPIYNAWSQGADIRVEWDSDEDVVKYLVYGSKTNNFTPAATNQISNQGSVPQYIHHPMGRISTAAESTNVWYYRVVAIGRNGTQSAPSAQSNAATMAYIDWCLGLPNANVTTGQEQSGENGYKAINGVWNSSSDKWCCTAVSASGWMRVDLGASREISRFMLVHAPILEGYGATAGYYIQYSNAATGPAGNSDTGWTEVVRVTGNTDTITYHDLAAPITARWLRLRITAGDGGSNTVRLYEFCAMSNPNASAVSFAANARIVYSAADASNAKFDVAYDYVNNDGKTEGNTQFKWFRQVGDTAIQIPGATGKSVTIPNADVRSAQSVKCEISIYDSDGMAGRTSTAELATYTGNALREPSVAAVREQSTANNTAGNLVNGNYTTKWDAPTNSSYSGYQGPLPHYATFDMGALRSFSQINVFHANSYATQDYDADPRIPTYDFDIMYSADNVTWTNANALNWSVKEIRANTSAITRITFDGPMSARYIKIIVYTPNAGFDSWDVDYKSVRILQIEAPRCIID